MVKYHTHTHRHTHIQTTSRPRSVVPYVHPHSHLSPPTPPPSTSGTLTPFRRQNVRQIHGPQGHLASGHARLPDSTTATCARVPDRSSNFLCGPEGTGDPSSWLPDEHGREGDLVRCSCVAVVFQHHVCKGESSAGGWRQVTAGSFTPGNVGRRGLLPVLYFKWNS